MTKPVRQGRIARAHVKMWGLTWYLKFALSLEEVGVCVDEFLSLWEHNVSEFASADIILFEVPFSPSVLGPSSSIEGVAYWGL